MTRHRGEVRRGEDRTVEAAAPFPRERLDGARPGRLKQLEQADARLHGCAVGIEQRGRVFAHLPGAEERAEGLDRRGAIFDHNLDTIDP